MAAVKTRNTATLMTEGSIVKSLLLFALPLIFGNLLQQMYNTADSIIVGNFVGSNALAAVGSSGSPIYLLIGFSQGLAVGAGVVVSQYLGAGDHRETREAVHTALAIAVVMGLLLTVGGVACGCVAKEVFPCKKQSRSSRKKDTRTNGRVILKNAPTPIPEMV